jgi:putative ABC transport system permease protein
MRTTNLIFSLIIAVGVIYSTARISLAERSREFATLRVLGFSQREIGTILWSELLLLTTLAIPLGWLLGYGLSYATVNAFDRELFRMPLVVHTHTYAYAAIVVLIAMQVASWIVQQLLNSMKLVEVLKTRE